MPLPFLEEYGIRLLPLDGFHDTLPAADPAPHQPGAPSCGKE